MSRRKLRQLQIEQLEDRRVMSATPIELDADYTQALLARDILMDSEVRASFARVSDLSQYTEADFAAATQWVLVAQLDANLQALAAEGGFTIDSATGILPGSYYVSLGEGGREQLISALSDESDVDYFYPMVPFEIETRSIPNDPYLEFQWHLINYGQLVGAPDGQFIYGEVDIDINIEGAWDKATGKGVQIAIVDDGVQMNHPDLADNIRADLARSLLGGDANPTGNASHGTAVAGLAAGVGNNGIGTTGVAYEADIVPIRLLGLNTGNANVTTDSLIATALLHQFQTIEVYNHSYGLVTQTARTMHDFGPLSLTALRNSVFFGRGGKGNIHVFSAGNDGDQDTSSQYSGLTNSRYTIAVTSVDHDGVTLNADGTSTIYPEGGANILVAAPSGSVALDIIRDTLLGSGIWTTDRTGDNGYNQGPDENNLELDNDYFDDLDYTSRFTGTSAAAPLVSGVIALMLEVNPELTYRDVQHILVRSAKQNNPEDLSWIVNAREFQLDPLVPPPGTLTMGGPWFGSANYLIDQAETLYANGAGFTVSQAIGSWVDTGWGHGLLDAALAVELASNWATVGGQVSELTWTTDNELSGKIWPAHISSEETGEFLVPGGVAGDGDDSADFGDFYDEFGEEENPFYEEEGDPPVLVPKDDIVNDRDVFSVATGLPGIPLSLVHDIPSMAVEWVELRLQLGGGNIDDLDSLRIALVSPDGTTSEFNSFSIPSANARDHFDGLNVFGNPAGDLGTLDLIFTTNRHWGERTEMNTRYDQTGTPFTDGWRLVFENYSGSEFNIASYNVTFHGIDTAGTGRIKGSVGIDENGDNTFDFNRANGVNEAYAAGVMVYLDVDQDGVRDSTEPYFQTGNDGNYYFDVAPGTYDVRIDETMLPERLNNQANIDKLQLQPVTTVTIAQEGDRVVADHHTVDPFVAGLNEFLTPNLATVATSFDVNGAVFADLDGDGVKDDNESGLPGVEVYFDVNKNGVYNPSIDLISVTDGDGAYYFQVTAPAGFYRVVVREGTTGIFTEATNSDEGVKFVFARPGDLIDPADRDGDGIADPNTPNDARDLEYFGFSEVIEPPPPPGPDDPPIDPNTPGAISGIVYIDTNGSGQRDPGEVGAMNVTVYLDADNDNTFDAGEQFLTTSSSGSYLFNSLAPSQTYTVRIVPPTDFILTGPAGSEYSESLLPGEVAKNLNFGIKTTLVDDWGDLPASFNATLAEDNGARHVVSSIFALGAVSDAESNGVESALANADDVAVTDDEDGVVAATLLVSDTVWQITATAKSNGGFLQAWIDFNGNGVFDASEHVQFKTSAGAVSGVTKKVLNAGANVLYVDVPAGVLATNVANTGGVIYARFRYGEETINDYRGAALTGEVEDYRFTVVVPFVDPGLQVQHGPDFNDDSQVSGMDFLLWQIGFGKSGNATAADGDSNSDGRVDRQDLAQWSNEYGAGGVPAVVVETGDFNGDGEVSGMDFLAWQLNYGNQFASQANGDGNDDAKVNAADLSIWESQYGDGNSSVVAALTASEQGDSGSTTLTPYVASGANAPSGQVGGLVTLGPAVPASSLTNESDSAPVVTNSTSRAKFESTALAGGAQQRFRQSLSLGNVVRDLLHRPRFETVTTDTSFKETVNLADLGFALRDRALDRLFTRRDRPADELPWHCTHDDALAEALEAVLSEEVEWRLS